MLTQLAASIWRDLMVPNVPSSGENEPDKAEIRAWGTYVESAITAGQLSNANWEATKAALTADLNHADGALGVVFNDSTQVNNGLYVKAGASGGGSWVQVTTFLPGYQFVTAIADTGASTANAIVATTSPRLPAGDGVALVVLKVPETNTNGTVTVAFDGGAALGIKIGSGANPEIGGLVADAVLMGVVSNSGTQFRLVSDQASSSILAAAAAALAEMRTRWVGDFVDDAACDAYLTGNGLTKGGGTAYFNTSTDIWRYWDGAAWQAMPFATIADGYVTTAKLADGAVTKAKMESTLFLDRNLMPNAFLKFDGRANSAPLTTGPAFPCDNYKVGVSLTTPAVSIQRVTNSPFPSYPGVKNAVKIEVTNGAAMGAADFLESLRGVEGGDTDRLRWGTAAARKITIGHLMRIELAAGTSGQMAFLITQFNDAGTVNRWYTKAVEYDTDTDYLLSLVIDGNETDVLPGRGKKGFHVLAILALGGDFDNATQPEEWVSPSSGTQSVPGITNFCATTGNIAYHGPMVVFPGEHEITIEDMLDAERSEKEEGEWCQRYLPVIKAAQAVGPICAAAQCYSATSAAAHIDLPVEAFKLPTGLTVSNNSHLELLAAGGTTAAVTNVALTDTVATLKNVRVTFTVASGLAAGNMTQPRFKNSAGRLVFTGCDLF